MLKKARQVLVAAAALCAVQVASAATVTLTFEGLQNNEAVNGFYGGTSGNLGSVGTNYGITFNNAVALIDCDALPAGTMGCGNFAFEPSSPTALFFKRDSVTLNVERGFIESFGFDYSTIDRPGFALVYSGLDGTGDLLGRIDLAVTGATCQGDPNGDFCRWQNGLVEFSGIAHSIVFGGPADGIAYDDIFFGNLTVPDPNPNPDPDPVPEPTSLALVGLALVGLRLARKA